MSSPPGEPMRHTLSTLGTIALELTLLAVAILLIL